MAVALLFAGVFGVKAGEPTALDLIKEGNRYVGDPSKDKVVEITSEKSIGTLTPNIWYINYFDPDTKFKITQVKFGGGQKMEVKRPWRMFKSQKVESDIFDLAKLDVDSDEAIKVAVSDPLLGKLTLKATQLWLERLDGVPVWKVRLWAAKLNPPTESVNIGEVFVSAKEGKIVKTDLHISRVD